MIMHDGFAKSALALQVRGCIAIGFRPNSISAAYSTDSRDRKKAWRDNVHIMRSHLREKLGRNDPCPCGSGRKYKRCCLQNESAPVPEDTPWQRQREASDRLTGEMLKFARRRFEDEILLAWMDFNQTFFAPLLEKAADEAQIFFPFLLFDWDPDRPRARRGRQPKPGVVARIFMEEKSKRLTDLERLILEQSIVQPLSFYEVVDCDPGRGMVLRDVLIGGESFVEEHAGSQFLRQGDLVYAQLSPLPGVTAASRMAPIIIPPRHKAEIVELRIELRRKVAKLNRDLAAEDLIHYREKIRRVYLDTRDALNSPPKLANTDGDPLLFHTLTYEVGSAQVAFDGLAPLAWGESKEDLLEEAEMDENGVLCGVSFDWRKQGNAMHPNWDNTIMGHIRILGRSMLVEVNSANRAKAIREEIERRLGILAVLKETRAKTPEQMVEESKRRKGTEARLLEGNSNGREIDPEAQQHLQEFLQEESNAWVYRKLPVLGGRTPMEAVADPDGREIVESLLLEWERGKQEATAPGAFLPDVGAVRNLLNLEAR